MDSTLSKDGEDRERKSLRLSSLSFPDPEQFERLEEWDPNNAQHSFTFENSQSLALDNSQRSIIHEWNDEEDVRNVYDIEPPDVPALEEDNRQMPRPSVLNASTGLLSLRSLVAENVSWHGPSPYLTSIEESSHNTQNSPHEIADEESPLITAQDKVR